MNKLKEIILAGQKTNYILIIPKSFYTKDLKHKNESIISYIYEVKGEHVTITNFDTTLKLIITFAELESYVRSETFSLTLKIRL